MNMRELSGDRSSSLPSIRWYFVIAIVLMLATFGAWVFWSKIVGRMKGGNVGTLFKKRSP